MLEAAISIVIFIIISGVKECMSGLACTKKRWLCYAASSDCMYGTHGTSGQPRKDSIEDVVNIVEKSKLDK